MVDVLLGESAPATCANRNLADPVAYGSFELAGGERTTVQISDVSLSPFKLEDASCLPHSLDKASRGSPSRNLQAHAR